MVAPLGAPTRTGFDEGRASLDAQFTGLFNLIGVQVMHLHDHFEGHITRGFHQLHNFRFHIGVVPGEKFAQVHHQIHLLGAVGQKPFGLSDFGRGLVSAGGETDGPPHEGIARGWNQPANFADPAGEGMHGDKTVFNGIGGHLFDFSGPMGGLNGTDVNHAGDLPGGEIHWHLDDFTLLIDSTHILQLSFFD